MLKYILIFSVYSVKNNSFFLFWTPTQKPQTYLSKNNSTVLMYLHYTKKNYVYNIQKIYIKTSNMSWKVNLKKCFYVLGTWVMLGISASVCVCIYIYIYIYIYMFFCFVILCRGLNIFFKKAIIIIIEDESDDS